MKEVKKKIYNSTSKECLTSRFWKIFSLLFFETQEQLQYATEGQNIYLRRKKLSGQKRERETEQL